MQMGNATEILRALRRAKRVLIPLHLNPDGDAVGSALALGHLLESWKTSVETISADPIPRKLLFLPGTEKIRQVDLSALDLNDYDLLLLADANKLRRFTRKKDLQLPKGLVVACIDHHPNSIPHPILSYIHPEASSATELIFDLMKSWKEKITPEMAQCLLTGILTDTGHFRYRLVTPELLEKAAELVRLGADQNKITLRIYYSWSPSALALWATLLNNAKIKDRILYTTLSRTEIEKIGIESSELSNARAYATSELLRAITGTKAAAVFTEEEEGIHVNLRSRIEADVGKVAATFGGGGHKRAAAFTFKGTLEKAVDKTLELLSNIK